MTGVWNIQLIHGDVSVLLVPALFWHGGGKDRKVQWRCVRTANSHNSRARKIQLQLSALRVRNSKGHKSHRGCRGSCNYRGICATCIWFSEPCLVCVAVMCWAAFGSILSFFFSEKRENTQPPPTSLPSGPVIYRMANRRTVLSTQPHSRCLPWYNLYKRQIEFIAMSLAQQPEPWGWLWL